MSSILERALAVGRKSKPSKAEKMTEEIEALLAYAEGRITITQLARALGLKRANATVYTWVCRTLCESVANGAIRLVTNGDPVPRVSGDAPRSARTQRGKKRALRADGRPRKPKIKADGRDYHWNEGRTFIHPKTGKKVVVPGHWRKNPKRTHTRGRPWSKARREAQERKKKSRPNPGAVTSGKRRPRNTLRRTQIEQRDQLRAENKMLAQANKDNAPDRPSKHHVWVRPVMIQRGGDTKITVKGYWKDTRKH